jgi:hypothetical protein
MAEKADVELSCSTLDLLHNPIGLITAVVKYPFLPDSVVKRRTFHMVPRRRIELLSSARQAGIISIIRTGVGGPDRIRTYNAIGESFTDS